MAQNIFYQCTRDDGKIVESVETGKQRGKVGQDIFYQCKRDDGSIVESVETGKQREENGPEYFLPVYPRRRKNC